MHVFLACPRKSPSALLHHIHLRRRTTLSVYSPTPLLYTHESKTSYMDSPGIMCHRRDVACDGGVNIVVPRLDSQVYQVSRTKRPSKLFSQTLTTWNIHDTNVSSWSISRFVDPQQKAESALFLLYFCTLFAYLNTEGPRRTFLPLTTGLLLVHLNQSQ